MFIVNTKQRHFIPENPVIDRNDFYWQSHHDLSITADFRAHTKKNKIAMLSSLATTSNFKKCSEMQSHAFKFLTSNMPFWCLKLFQASLTKQSIYFDIETHIFFE